MQETAGQRLAKARQARGLSVDEAAHATRMRPDKILALENDDYSRFGSNAYAKGFLLIYSRLLKVDVSEEVRLLDAPHVLRVRDYQYLSNAAEAPAPPPERITRFYQRPARPSAAPLVAFVLLAVIAVTGFYFFTMSQRLGNLGTRSAAGLPPTAAANVSGDAAPIEPTPAASTSTEEPAPAATETTEPAAPAHENAATVETPADPATTAPSPDPAQAEAQHPPVTAAPTPPPAPVPAEITVAAKKKTWVTIRQDDPKSRPVFNDYVYPKALPLTFRGARLFIEARNPESLEIRKNGEPLAYQAGVAVQ